MLKDCEQDKEVDSVMVRRRKPALFTIGRKRTITFGKVLKGTGTAIKKEVKRRDKARKRLLNQMEKERIRTLRRKAKREKELRKFVAKKQRETEIVFGPRFVRKRR